MAFKGGTSLSRIYNLIERYSEDVDITIDYRNFKNNIDITKTSRSQLKKISEELKKQLISYVTQTIQPYLQKESKKLNTNNIEISISDNGEKLLFYYPTALANHSENYLRDHVLLEFGVRNSTEPCKNHAIAPLLAQCNMENLFTLPTTNIDVLSPIRTFWEFV